MNKFLVLTYIAVAILASGYAKADSWMESSDLGGHVVKELSAEFNPKTFEIVVSGYRQTDCTKQVFLAEQESKTIVLKVINTTPFESFCTQRISTFTKQIPVRHLIYMANLVIDPNTEYTLAVEGSPLTVTVHGSELLPY